LPTAGSAVVSPSAESAVVLPTAGSAVSRCTAQGETVTCTQPVRTTTTTTRKMTVLVALAPATTQGAPLLRAAGLTLLHTHPRASHMQAPALCPSAHAAAVQQGPGPRPTCASACCTQASSMCRHMRRCPCAPKEGGPPTHLELDVHLLGLHVPAAPAPAPTPVAAPIPPRAMDEHGGGVVWVHGAGHLAARAVLMQRLQPPLVVHVVPLQAHDAHGQQLHGPASTRQGKSRCMGLQAHARVRAGAWACQHAPGREQVHGPASSPQGESRCMGLQAHSRVRAPVKRWGRGGHRGARAPSSSTHVCLTGPHTPLLAHQTSVQHPQPLSSNTSMFFSTIYWTRDCKCLCQEVQHEGLNQGHEPMRARVGTSS